MGNIHVFYHRIPALSTSIISSIALGFTLASGLRCDFILVAARPGEFLEYATEEGLLVELYESSLGIACDTQPAFSRDGDFLWNLSFFFLGFSVYFWFDGWNTVLATDNNCWPHRAILETFIYFIRHINSSSSSHLFDVRS
mmetsp:Transcript_12033/g.18461  ORF Transcript_12033/g.18461 Transcript_12033/m.18461 type:complete len:141 (+) Transcript_12033:246-668(+)